MKSSEHKSTFRLVIKNDVSNYVKDNSSVVCHMCDKDNIENLKNQLIKHWNIDVKNEDEKLSGIYILIGYDKNKRIFTLYTGQSSVGIIDGVFGRIKQHLKDDYSGKWDKCITFTGVLNGSHVDYLEYNFFNNAQHVGNYYCINKINPPKAAFDECDESRMENFLKDIEDLTDNCMQLYIFSERKNNTSSIENTSEIENTDTNIDDDTYPIDDEENYVMRYMKSFVENSESLGYFPNKSYNITTGKSLIVNRLDKKTYYIGCYKDKIQCTIMIPINEMNTLGKLLIDNRDNIKKEFGVDMTYLENRKNEKDNRGQFDIILFGTNIEDISKFKDYHMWHIKNTNILMNIIKKYSSICLLHRENEIVSESGEEKQLSENIQKLYSQQFREGHVNNPFNAFEYDGFNFKTNILSNIIKYICTYHVIQDKEKFYDTIKDFPLIFNKNKNILENGSLVEGTKDIYVELKTGGEPTTKELIRKIVSMFGKDYPKIDYVNKPKTKTSLTEGF